VTPAGAPESPTRAGLVLAGLEVRLEGKALFAPLTRTVGPGVILGVTGPSGCGKTSLLLALSGLLGSPFEVRGDLGLNGRSLGGLPAERRRIGLIFQDPLLLPHLSVGQNLAFGLNRRRVAGRGARRRLVAEALQRIELAGFADRDPATLSGGQRARVALMRCLLAEPEALLLDEPFAALDPPLRRAMRSLLAELVASRRLPTVLVTHDREDMEALTNCRLCLEKPR